MRLRLILAFGLVVFVSIASIVLVLWRTTQREVNTFMFRGGMVGVEQMVDALEDYYRANRSWDGIEIFVQQTFGSARRAGGQAPHGMGMMNQRLRLYDAEGKILADTREPAPTGQLSEAQKSDAISLNAGRRVIGYLVFDGELAFTRGDEVNLMARLNRAALTAAVAGGALSLLLAALLTYHLSRPIRALKEGADRLAAGDLSQRVSVQGDPEVASLGLAFNQMAASLQKAEINRRAITADIAHELRNPLSVQRAHLEALQDGIYPLDPDSLEPVLAQNLLLSRLVEDLRTLALAEAGQLTLHKTQVDIATLAERSADRFSPQAASKQIEIQFIQPRQSVPALNADPGRIEQILSNLIANALRHTPQVGRVILGIRTDHDWAYITIRDTGPGIHEEALPRIFDRFYRADPSRSREEGGSGLGLSIARQLARAHSGDLTAANHPEGGAVFTLTLPLSGKNPSS